MDNSDENKVASAAGGNSTKRLVIIAIALMAVVIIGLTIALINANKKNNNKKTQDEPVPTINDVSEATPTEAPSGTPVPTETGTPEPTGAGKDTPTPTQAVTGAPTPTEAGKGTPTPSASPTPKPEEIDGYLVEYSAGNTWTDGGVTMMNLEFGIRNNAKEAISGGWTLEVEIEGLAKADGWNGTFSVKGDTLTIKSANYNGDIAKGATQVVGCNLGVKKDALKVVKATLNGVACTVRAGVVDQNKQNNNNGNGNGNGNGGNDVDVEEMLKRSKDAVQGDDWLHTDGTRILDKDGKEVWLTGLNWFGYNTGTNTFDGLWACDLNGALAAIADHGFNLLRVPISAELILQWKAGNAPSANFNNATNSYLVGMNSLEIWDYVVGQCHANGLKIMIDIHSAKTDAMGHMKPLWVDGDITEQDYLDALSWMADRYKNDDTIIAYDLKNEPHGKPNESPKAIWNNSKDANNWKYIAEKAANAVLSKNPNVLVLVEGIEIYPIDVTKNGNFASTNEKDYYYNWWGGNLRGVADAPVNLGKYQNKLVYSPHDYGPTVYKQPWFDKAYTFDTLMEDCWEDNWF